MAIAHIHPYGDPCSWWCRHYPWPVLSLVWRFTDVFKCLEGESEKGK